MNNNTKKPFFIPAGKLSEPLVNGLMVTLDQILCTASYHSGALRPNPK